MGESASSDVRGLLRAARETLAAAFSGAGAASAEPALEADILMTHVLGVSRAWLFSNAGQRLADDQAEGYRDLVRRRARGEPIAYLTGAREFWSLDFRVTPDVLIPRPETELLVGIALAHIPPASGRRIVDLGTGTGAIAVAIAVERPGCEMHATDISPAALTVARENIERLAPGRVQLHEGSWLQPVSGTFDLVVSNPPYVDAGDSHLRQGDCRFEPATALTPGKDGLAAIRQIAEDALPRLRPGGMLAFEHGYEQGEACRQLLEGLGYIGIRTENDLEGRERVTMGRKG